MRKKIIIFGCGGVGIKVKEKLEHEGDEIVAYCDNNPEKWGKTLANVTIIPPLEIEKYQFDYIAIGIYKAAKAIYQQIVEMGVDEKKIIIPLEPQRIYVNPDVYSLDELTYISKEDKQSECTKRYEKYHIQIEDKSFFDKLANLKKVLIDNNIPRNKVCVVSGAVLQAYGLRESKLFDDIDIIMTSDLRKLYGTGLVIVSECVEMHPQDEYMISDDEIIINIENHFIFSDLKFLNIEIYYEHLKKRNNNEYLLLEKYL